MTRRGDARATCGDCEEAACVDCGGCDCTPSGCLTCCRDCGRPCTFEKDGEGFHA